jgi:hypothetical protein
MKQIPMWIKKISSFFHKLSFRPILIGILLSCLLLIPSVLAGICQQITAYRSNECSVTLYEKDGALIASEEGLVESAARYSLLESFYRIQTNKKEIAYAPGDPENDHYIVADIFLNGTNTVLKCYFSLDGTSDYLIDQNGKIYTVSSLYTRKFLASAHAASFYTASTPPTLTTIDNDHISPTKINWSYRNLENRFVSVTDQKHDSSSTVYEITGAIGLRFDQNPDQCLVSVYEHQKLIYEGALSGVSTVAVSSQSELFIRVNATWKQKESSPFYGSVQYDFHAQIRNRSDFALSADTVYPGEWVMLTATNISDPQKIIFTADWCAPPTFYQSGQTVYALLAIPKDTDQTSLQFDISYGASAKAFRIALMPQQKKPSSWKSTDFISPQLFIPDTLNEYTNHFHSIAPLAYSPPRFYGSFLDPLTEGFSIGYRHGDFILLTQDTIFPLLGTEYRLATKATESVPALNHGIVCQTGESQALGVYVVLDHGCGLRTWYCHLSRAEVSEGDTIQKGQTIGYTGDSGIATSNGFLLITTINDIPIEPSSVVGNTIIE